VGRTAADTGVGADRPRHAEEVVTDPVVGRGCEDNGADGLAGQRVRRERRPVPHGDRDQPSPLPFSDLGEEEIRKLSAELVEIDRAAEQAVTDQHTR
jgi:hypothetical protein